jgi:exopolyphosphatase / guanosine-5'-triphosphate,3'-diphosphate pyrophosphatase
MQDHQHRSIHAVIDVGSKSVRLLVARRLSASAFEVVDEERFDSRLGEGQADGYLTEAASERGLRALRIMVQIARSYGPDRIVAVGTEALRRAANASDFIERAFQQTGVRVRILEAGEEAFASFVGVVNATDLRSACLVDIGGGSLEVMRVEDRRLVQVSSVPLGAIYATELFLQSDPPTNKEVRALRKAVRHAVGDNLRSDIVYGTGGAIRNIGRMARVRRGYPVRRLHGFPVERRETRRLARALCSAGAPERRKLPGLNLDRVATLPAAAVVIDEVMDIVGASSLQVSGQGMREGLLWQELRGEAAVLPDVRTSSVAGLAAANGVDIVNAEPEVSVAARMFHATRPIHGYGPAELDLLLHAARLAEIGMHVDYYNRDRHAEYLVHSGDLHGFSHREIVLLASIVRWSMSGSADLKSYAAIMESGDDRRVSVLAALLGTARAVWRRTPSPVRDIEARLLGDALSLALVGGGPLDAELHALERHTRRIENALKVKVILAARS